MKLDFGLVQLIISWFLCFSLVLGSRPSWRDVAISQENIQSSPFSMYIIWYWHLWKCKRYNLSLELITYWRRIKKTFGKCTELCLTFLPHKDDEQLSDKCFLVCLHSKKSGLDLADDKIYKAKSLASFFFGNLKYACFTNCKHWTSLSYLRDLLWSF